MTSDEVFPNPLVKEVVFQIRFPNLFFLADRIGDFQVKVMKEFPKSELLLRRHFLLTDEGDTDKLERMVGELKDQEAVNRVWQFESEQGVRLDITSNSLALVSKSHKSYRLGEERPFRDVVAFVTSCFFDVTQVPIIKRIGLRYIDECPVPENNSERFAEYYTTVFPLERFPLENATAMDYKVIIDRGPHKLRYVESLRGQGENRSLILDFDAWAEDIQPSATIETTDTLHEIIWNEFEATIREPVREYMRTPSENAHVPQ